MKKLLPKSIVALLLLTGLFAYNIPEKPKLESFSRGEELLYKIKYNLYFNVNVAEMRFKVSDSLQKFGDQQLLHLNAEGKTYRFYDNFFKVRDYFNSYVDPETFRPKVYTSSVNEGKYKKKEYYLFSQDQEYVKNNKGKKFDLEENTWDILSILYLARTFDYSKMKPGDSVMMNTFIDNKSYPVGLKYIKDEVIKTQSGKYKTHVIKPLLIVGEVFDSEDEMFIWVSADENKIPVVIESGIAVGAVRAELSTYKGLKHELSSKINE